MLSINMTTMCDFNDYIIYQNKDKNVAGISIGLKIFSLIMYLIGCLGIFTIFGIIHFEKYGQDCQKRSFPDQILSFNCKMFMIIMPIYWGISQIRWIFGPIGYTMTVFRYYLLSSLLSFPLGITESILFQCLMIFSWKKCAMISDEFLATYFNIANLMMAQIISMIRLMSGEYERKDFFFYWSGAEVQIEKPYVLCRGCILFHE